MIAKLDLGQVTAAMPAQCQALWKSRDLSLQFATEGRTWLLAVKAGVADA